MSTRLSTERSWRCSVCRGGSSLFTLRHGNRSILKHIRGGHKILIEDDVDSSSQGDPPSEALNESTSPAVSPSPIAKALY